MQKLATVLTSLDPMRRLFVLAATVGVFAAVLMLARMGGTGPTALLYSNLDPGAAGEVIASLDQMGAPYEVRGSAIYVEPARRDSLRMALAAEGKPASGSAGYEILDGLSGFGTTSQMFDAAYWRAREGELARTIMANPQIQAARVHISNPSTRGLRSGTPAAASVVVTASGGLTPPQARALRFLVASAVSGLNPDTVSIIDSQRGLVTNGEEAGSTSGEDRSEKLRRNVERLLAARVGPGNAVVEVSVETVTEREQIVERTFDPDSRVAISTVTQETVASASDRRDGSVTVASNLPDGAAGGSGADSTSTDNQTREQVNYEVSETKREILRTPGAVKRVSVAVLVDGIRVPAEDGSVAWEPRPEAELEALRELVASTVGFDESRGDTITLRSMEFPAQAVLGTEAPAPSLLDRLHLDVMKLVQVGVLALTALVLGLFVVRPILSGGARPAPGVPQGLPAPDTAGVAGKTAPSTLPAPLSGTPSLPPLTGEIDTGFTPKMAMVEDMGGFGSGSGGEGKPADPAARLRQLVSGRQAEAAAILQDWMEKA